MESGEEGNDAGDDHSVAKPNRLDSGGGSQKDKLRHRNSGKGSTWTSSVHVPTSDIPINTKTRSIGRVPSNPSLPGQTADPDISSVPDATSPSGSDFLHASGLTSKRLVREVENNMEEDDEEEDEQDSDDGKEEEEENAEAGEGEPAAVRMSLMSLLAETDEEVGSGGLAYMMENDEEDEDEDEDSGPGYSSCCVCMVKHRGAAFEPCGHSFCRLCSREMWVERGNCPLCNNYILEILDIF